MTQIDSIRVDVPSTLARIRQFYSQRKERVAREAAFLEEQGIGLLSSISRRSRLRQPPAYGNSESGGRQLCVGLDLFGICAAGSRHGKQLWISFRKNMPKRTCFSDSRFAKRCRHFRALKISLWLPRLEIAVRNEIAGLTGCDPGKKWILLSFTTLDWNEEALNKSGAHQRL